MRRLTDEEILLVTGGTETLSTVFVGGTLPDPEPEPFPDWPDPGGDDGGGGGSGGGDPDPEPDPCVHTSPPPSVSPSGVSLEKVRDHIADIASTIRQMPNYQTIEYGAVVVLMPDGILRHGFIHIGDASSVNMPTTLSPGEKIVAWIHSHPVDNQLGANNGIPSSPGNSASASDSDTERAALLLQNARVDPGSLMYILNANNGAVNEYTAQGGHNRTLGPDISSDTTCGSGG